MTIIDFRKATYFKQFEKRLGRVRLDIDYAGVTRVRVAANLSPDDQVLLTAKTRAQYDALMASCALQGEPSTWARFRSNQLYCERLHMLAAGVRVSPLGSLEMSCAVYERQYPGISKPLALLITGELTKLKQMHIKNGTFENNAKAYDGAYDQEETLFADEF